MKKHIKNTTILLLLLFISLVHLNAMERPEIRFGGEQILMIELKDWNKSELTLEILANDGKMVYTDIITGQDKSIKEYDLEDLSIGEYHIILYGFKRRTIAKFSKNLNGLQMLEEEIVELFSPSIHISRKNIKLDYKAYGEDVNISIIGENGVAYAALYEGELLLDKRINITNLSSGNYTLIVNSESQNTILGFRR